MNRLRIAAVMALSLSLATGASMTDRSVAAGTPDIDTRDRDSVPRMSDPLTNALQPSVPLAQPPVRSGNPLWAIPLKSLVATRERPIFQPSRRPPAPAVVAPEVRIATPLATSSADAGPPPLNLVGVIVGTNESIAVFVNEPTRDIVRLKIGEGYDGWILRSAKERGVTLEKGEHTAVFSIPPPGGGRQ